jgi:N-acetylmuramoyl-L-alanine amidase
LKRFQRLIVVLGLLGVALGVVAIGIGGPPAPPPLRVVVIDAGHGGEDPGAVGADGTKEKDVTLAVARLVRMAALADPTMQVVLTRDSDVFVELADRAKAANQRGATLFVSLHVNACSDPSVCGVETYIDAKQSGDGASARLAAALQVRVAGVMGSRDRGVRTASLFITRAAMPAALVEMGFITNFQERGALRNLARQKEIAAAVYAGIRASLADEN